MKNMFLFLIGIGLVSGSISFLSAKTQLNQGVREDGLDPSLLTEKGRGAWIAPDEAFELIPKILGESGDELPPPSANATVIITSDDGFGASRQPNEPSFLNYPAGRYLWCGRQGGGFYLDITRFKFPLATLPNGVTITDAKILAYQILSAGGDSRIDRTQVSPSDDAWTARTLTWNYILANPADPPILLQYVTGLGWRTFTNAALATQVQTENNASDDVLSVEFDAPVGSNTYFRDYENREYFMSNEARLHVEIQVDWDVSIESIDDPVINDGGFGLKDPNVPFNPTMTVRNRGANNINNAEVRMEITGPAPAPVTQVMNTGFLTNTTGEQSMAFDWFTPGDEPSMYTLVFTARITDPAGHDPDDNPTNNIKSGDFYSWGDRNYIGCIYTTAPPTIDGNVYRESGEWSGAFSIDISDVHGMAGSAGLTDGGPNPPGSALLHAMNDDRFLYIGIETVDSTNTYFDQDGLYFDEDHNHLWHPRNKEGNFWQINDYQQEVAFQRIPSFSVTYNPTMVFSSVDLQPTGLEYEIAIPLGGKMDPDWYLDPAEVSNNVMGAHIWTWDYANEAYGYFPSRMPGSSWSLPMDYGHICVDLPSLASNLEASNGLYNSKALHLQSPGIVGGKGEVDILYQVPSTHHVLLQVYDVMGRQVATLVDGKVEAGVNIAKFNSNELSSGIYFYRLTTQSLSKTGKLVVIK
jgi:hypothetical protein